MPNVDLRLAYATACNLPSPPNGPSRGHRLVCLHPSGIASQTLTAGDDSFAVVGRHTSCSLVLPIDPSVALRHVLVRSLALPSGGVALRVFDLQSGLGFVLADGSRQTAILAEGPVAFAIGAYALVALPTGGALPRELPPAVVDPAVRVNEQLAALQSAMSPYRANARPGRQSLITLMPKLVMLGEPVSARLDHLVAPRTHTLTLARAGRRATVRLTDQDLACGVIIGRSEKCHSEDLRRVTEVGTSRVHLLVVREGAEVVAYDLGSTQGTYMDDGRRVGRAVLSRARAETEFLRLGGTGAAVQLHLDAL